jgi:hypothetical protein
VVSIVEAAVILGLVVVDRLRTLAVRRAGGLA